MNGQLVSLIVRLVDQLSGPAAKVAQSVRGIGQAAASAAPALDGAAAAARRMGAGMMAAGRHLTLRLTTAISGVGVAIFKVGADFEKSMSQIVGLVGIAREEVNGWKEEILAISKDTTVSMKELGEAMFFIVSAGLRGADALAVLRAAAMAADAGLGDTKTVADAATSAINAYGAANLSAEKAVGILVAAVREGKLEASSLAPVLGRVIPVAAELGVSFDQVAASIAAMSRLGVDANEGATALRGILSTLLKPSKGAADALEEVGLSVAELRKQLKEKGLFEVLSTLRRAFGDNEEAMARVFPNARALSGVLNLVGNNAEAARKIFAALATEVGGSLKAAFDAVQKDAWKKWEDILIGLSTALWKLAEVLLPVLKPLMERVAQSVERVSEAFSALSPETQRFVVIAALVAAALGPVLIGLGLLATGLGFAFSGVGLLVGGLAALSGLLAPLVGGLMALALGVVRFGVLFAIGFARGIAAGFVASGATAALAAAARSLMVWVAGLGVRAAIIAAVAGGKIMAGLSAGMSAAMGALAALGSTIASAIAAALAFLATPVGIAVMIGLAVAGVALLAYKYWDEIVKAFGDAKQWVTELAGKIGDALASINLFGAGRKLLESLWEGMKSLASDIVSWASSLGGRIWGAIRGALPFGGGGAAPASPRTTPQSFQPLAPATPRATPQSFQPLAPDARSGAVNNARASTTHISVGGITIRDAGDPEKTARAVVREIERYRQAGLYDGALA